MCGALKAQIDGLGTLSGLSWVQGAQGPDESRDMNSGTLQNLPHLLSAGLDLMSHPPPLSYHLYNGLESSTLPPVSVSVKWDRPMRHTHDVPGDTTYPQSQ